MQPVTQLLQLFQQVRVINPLAQGVLPDDSVADVLIENGVLRAIAPQIPPPPAATVHNGKGLILGPGLVDLYSQSGEPGFESRETLRSLTQAARAGGFTRLSLLPKTRPALDHPAALRLVRAAEQSLSSPEDLSSSVQQPVQQPVRLNLWGALTLGAKGQQMSELWELADAGAVGFADGLPLENLALVRRLLEYLRPLGRPVALWACDRTLSGDGVAREGSISLHLGLPGVPDLAETAALAALIECVRETQTPVHLMRISTARSVELIRRAKAEGVPITASVSWLHLLFDCGDLAGYDPNLRLDPPLGNPADRRLLGEAVRRGVVDAIAIDHTPLTYEEKTVAFATAPPGAIGLELALPLLWQRFVASGQWSAVELWQRLSTAPAQCLGQQPPALHLDATAEFVLFDPQLRWMVTAERLRSIASNTSYLGKEICGKVLLNY